MCISKKINANKLPFVILLGMLTGAQILPTAINTVVLGSADFIAQVFMRLLKLVSLPIIFLSIATTISGLDHRDELKTTGMQVLRYTLGTTICAATIALVLFLIVDPSSMQLGIPHAGIADTTQSMNYIDYLLQAIPSNVIQTFAENNVIGTLLIAVGLGISTLSLPTKQKNNLHELFSSLYAAIFKLTTWILKLVPVAIWAFTADFTATILSNKLEGKTLSLYLFCVVAANILQAAIVLPLLLKSKNIPPRKAFSQVMPALQVAFWSKSSSAALPVALSCIKKESGVPEKVANISMPLCISINMNGCAAFILTTVFFVAKCHGVLFTAPEMLVWILIATLTAVGNAGVPMGCYFLSCALLSSMNIPLDIMGYILPFYMLIDMLESAINVWSDICVTMAVSKDLEEAALDEQLETA